jgi:ubiquinone/menaquinone biosynthesis C-methylase UbiE
MTETPGDLKSGIITYYLESERAYFNWGRDEQRFGIYAVHMGLEESPDHSDHYQSVKRMTAKVAATVVGGNPNQTILDAGCGTGAVSFEIAGRSPNLQIFGMNISPNQLDTAQRYKQLAGVGNVHFSQQDYLSPAFAPESFDCVVFCESFTHSNDKKKLLETVRGLSKPLGRLVIFDAFMNKPSLDTGDESLLNDLNQGWYIPSVISLADLKDMAYEMGYADLTVEDLSKRVLNSARLIGDNSEQRIAQGSTSTPVILKSRLAGIATKYLLEKETVGYFAVTAKLAA